MYKVKSLTSEKYYAAKVYFQELFESNPHKGKFVVTHGLSY